MPMTEVIRVVVTLKDKNKSGPLARQKNHDLVKICATFLVLVSVFMRREFSLAKGCQHQCMEVK